MPHKTTLTKYAQFLKTLELQEDTVKYYLWHTSKFLDWLGTKQLTNYALRKYHDELVELYDSVVSINLRLISINKYLRFVKNSYQFALMTHKEPPITKLTTTQLTRFLEAPLSSTRLIDLRDKALLELLYSTGLKVGKIIELETRHLDDLSKEIILDNNQHITIPALAWSYLQKYLTVREDASIWLFINLDRANKREDNNLSIRSIERIISKYGRKTNLKVTPQTLRNTLAHQLKLQGAQQQDIQAALHFQTKTGAHNYFAKI